MMGTHQNRRHRLNEDDKDDDLCAREISQTTHNQENRTLIQIEEKDKAMAVKTFDDLMGDNVAPRKTFIEENAHFAVNIDI